FLAAHVVGLSLTGVAFLPFIELVLHSNRGGEYGSDPFALRWIFFALFGPHDQYNPLLPPFGFILYVRVISIPLLLTVGGQNRGAHASVLPWLSVTTIAVIVLLSTPIKMALTHFVPSLATLNVFRLSPFWGFLAALGVGFALNNHE